MWKGSTIAGFFTGIVVAYAALMVVITLTGGWDALDLSPGTDADDRQERLLQIRAYDNCLDDPTCPLTPRAHIHWERLIQQEQDGEPDG